MKRLIIILGSLCFASTIYAQVWSADTLDYVDPADNLPTASAHINDMVLELRDTAEAHVTILNNHETRSDNLDDSVAIHVAILNTHESRLDDIEDDTTLFFNYGAGGELAGDTALFATTKDKVHGDRRVTTDSIKFVLWENEISSGDTLIYSVVYGDTLWDADGPMLYKIEGSDSNLTNNFDGGATFSSTQRYLYIYTVNSEDVGYTKFWIKIDVP